MNRVYWIQHFGKRILFTDYSNLDTDRLLEVIDWSIETVYPKFEMYPRNSILSLVDVNNTSASKAAVHALKDVENLWKPLYKKQAIIGLTPFHIIFLNAINRTVGSEIVPFKKRETALDWLVEE